MADLDFHALVVTWREILRGDPDVGGSGVHVSDSPEQPASYPRVIVGLSASEWVPLQLTSSLTLGQPFRQFVTLWARVEVVSPEGMGDARMLRNQLVNAVVRVARRNATLEGRVAIMVPKSVEFASGDGREGSMYEAATVFYEAQQLV